MTTSQPGLASIVPPSCAVREAKGDVPGAALFPEEAAALGAASEGRVLEFTVARTCARQAMRALGYDPRPILRGKEREPQWPAEVVGSITHCRGYSAAAVARRSALVAVGIDAEPHEPLPHGVRAKVAFRGELDWLDSQLDSPIHWDRVLFSAKESIYKAWFAITHAWLGFEDVVLTFDHEELSFLGRLCLPGPIVAGKELKSLRGRILIGDGLIFTAVSVEAPKPASKCL